MRALPLLLPLLLVPLATAAVKAPPRERAPAPGRTARATRRPGAGAASPAAVPLPPPAQLAPSPAEVGGEDPIELNVPHAFERATARERVSQLLRFWREAYGVRSSWQGDRVRMQGSVLGIDVQGQLLVTDAAVVGLARNPGWLWREKAQSYVDWMLRKYLHPTYAEPARSW